MKEKVTKKQTHTSIQKKKRKISSKRNLSVHFKKEKDFCFFLME